MTKTFYAIYNTKTKLFKGRGKREGVQWTEYPTQTYDKEGRAKGALKNHLKAFYSYKANKFKTSSLVVIPITVSWEEADTLEIYEGPIKIDTETLDIMKSL